MRIELLNSNGEWKKSSFSSEEELRNSFGISNIILEDEDFDDFKILIFKTRDDSFRHYKIWKDNVCECCGRELEE